MDILPLRFDISVFILELIVILVGCKLRLISKDGEVQIPRDGLDQGFHEEEGVARYSVHLWHHLIEVQRQYQVEGRIEVEKVKQGPLLVHNIVPLRDTCVETTLICKGIENSIETKGWDKSNPVPVMINTIFILKVENCGEQHGGAYDTDKDGKGVTEHGCCLGAVEEDGEDECEAYQVQSPAKKNQAHVRHVSLLEHDDFEEVSGHKVVKVNNDAVHQLIEKISVEPVIFHLQTVYFHILQKSTLLFHDDIMKEDW
jgi:hypothetical protein